MSARGADRAPCRRKAPAAASIPTSPTITTRPRSRASVGGEPAPDRWSRLPHRPARRRPRPPSAIPARAPSEARRRPRPTARARRSSGLRSTPSTRHPAARAIRTASWPISPRPITATVDPDLDLAAAKAVHRNRPEGREGRVLGRTPSGILEHRERGDDVELGVAREPAAGDRHAVARRQARASAPASSTTPAAL